MPISLAAIVDREALFSKNMHYESYVGVKASHRQVSMCASLR